MPRNSVEILSNTCLYNIFETYLSYWGYLLAVNLQIYLKTSSLKHANNVPKLPGIEYIAKNWALAMMLKALPLVHFWSVLSLKVQMMTSVRKTSKMLVWSAQNWSISSEIWPKNNHKIGHFLPIAFLRSLPRKFPRNSHEIDWFFCKFVAKNPAKFDFFFMTYQFKPCLNDNLGFSNSLYDSRTFTNGHLSTTATSLQRPVFLADSPYIDSCFNLSTMATLFCPQGGHWKEVQLYSFWYCTVYGDQC